MKEQISAELKVLEHAQDVRILYACESGSRAWGFPSKDSDYDVRFIYIHKPEWYLSIQSRRDVIERMIEPDLDLSGWDIRKALLLFRKSNPPLFEWLQSPIVYLQQGTFVDALRELMPDYYSPRSSMYHYLNMAQGNFRDYLKGERVWLKKYFYVLRPVLACKWIEQASGPAPMAFSVLVEQIITDAQLKAAIHDLTEQKRAGDELDKGPRIGVISEFIEDELARLDAKLADANKALPFEPLDALFRRTLEET